MRLYTLLKQFIQFMRTGIVSAKGGTQAVNTPQHFKLINGVKICWGVVNPFKHGDSITLPYSYAYAFALTNPIYNTGTTMNCSISNSISGNKLTLGAYDITTQTVSKKTNLGAVYIVIGV